MTEREEIILDKMKKTAQSAMAYFNGVVNFISSEKPNFLAATFNYSNAISKMSLFNSLYILEIGSDERASVKQFLDALQNFSNECSICITEQRCTPQLSENYQNLKDWYSNFDADCTTV